MESLPGASANMTRKPKPSKLTEKLPDQLELLVQRIATIPYREIFKRNTIWPMEEIIHAPTKDRQVHLLREWAQTKSNESSYIQLAGGLLLTTVSSCLQWPGTQNGHWSAASLFYCSMLLSLVAIVSGSQQLLVLPRDKRQWPAAEPSSTTNLAQQTFDNGTFSSDADAEREERAYLEKVVETMCIRRREDRPNNLQVFALQTPLMLLSLAVVMFLAGICAVIFAPLARHLAWDGNAKTAVMFGIVGLFSAVLFYGTSQIVHGMFCRDNHGPWVGTRIARIPT